MEMTMPYRSQRLVELESRLRTVCELHSAFVACLCAGLVILFVTKLNGELGLGLDEELWLFTGQFVVAVMGGLLCVATLCHGYLIRKILAEEDAAEHQS